MPPAGVSRLGKWQSLEWIRTIFPDPVPGRSNYVRGFIQVNKENSVANTRQSLLGGIESQLSRRIVDHMIFTIQQSQVTPTLVTQWMDSAKLNDQERKEVKAALDKAASK